jgi:hypothetical protein
VKKEQIKQKAYEYKKRRKENVITSYEDGDDMTVKHTKKPDIPLEKISCTTYF